jgi:hypothetical protein
MWVYANPLPFGIIKEAQEYLNYLEIPAKEEI